MKLEFECTIQGANKLLIGSVIFETFLVFCYLVGILSHHPTQFFDLDGEANLPAWFSSIQLFVIGQAFLLKGLQINSKTQLSRFFFYLGCLGFILLSADEAARIHETLNGVLQHVHLLPRFKDGNGIWIAIYILIGAALFFITSREILAMWNCYRRATLIMAMGVGVALFGGVVLEIVSYQYLRSGSTQLLYFIEVAFEEFFEMSGASITLYGALLMLTHK